MKEGKQRELSLFLCTHFVLSTFLKLVYQHNNLCRRLNRKLNKEKALCPTLFSDSFRESGSISGYLFDEKAHLASACFRLVNT